MGAIATEMLGREVSGRPQVNVWLLLSPAAPTAVRGWGTEGREERACREGRINTRTIAIRKGKKSLWSHSNMSLRADDKFWDEMEV